MHQSSLSEQLTQFFKLFALLLCGSCFAFPSCAKCRLQYETTLRICAMSSSSYFFESFFGFFSRMATILRPL